MSVISRDTLVFVISLIALLIGYYAYIIPYIVKS